MERNISAYTNWIHSFGKTKFQENLDSSTVLLDRLNNPQDSLKVIHVAGTNGKGSTCNYIANTLSQTCRVGLLRPLIWGLLLNLLK